MSQQKVAVIGLGRSGTTWISKVVDSSPFVFYLHEPDYVKAVECVPYVSDADDFEVWERYLKDYVVTLPTACSARSALKRPLFPKAYLGSLSARWSFLLFRGRLRLDQLLYQRQLIDNSLPYSQLREASMISTRGIEAQETDFSSAIRRGLPGIVR
jgi:hypothetical protein